MAGKKLCPLLSLALSTFENLTCDADLFTTNAATSSNKMMRVISVKIFNVERLL